MTIWKKYAITFPGLIMLCLSATSTARADTIGFTGTRYESLPAASLGGRCGAVVPTLIINNSIGIATGTSNLGDFSADASACLNTPFPAPITDGIFTWTFSDGETIFGTWSGLDTRVNLPGGGHLLTINETYFVTGGTGEFLGAIGTINETGSANSTGISAIANYTFTGTLTAPALVPTPEPASLTLLTTGLFMLARSAHKRLAAR